LKILHTSDWHLGKTLEGRQRIAEQKQFTNELCRIAQAENADLIIIAGDIYDSSNPPAAAEQLFYRSVTKLSNGGKRPVIVIAGNHDSPERLTAASPLAYENGIILLGSAKSKAQTGDYEYYSIRSSGEGFLELAIRGETAVIITMPYPSEKRLDEIIFQPETETEPEPKAETKTNTEAEAKPEGITKPEGIAKPDTSQKSYSQKIGEILKSLSENFRSDTINIIAGHFYITGGEITDSERDIAIGGVYAVNEAAIPKAQYTAMGHLHRPQRIKSENPIYYSGSPLQYSKSEIAYEKCVYIAKIEPAADAEVKKIPLTNYKPISVLKFASPEECMDNLDKIPENSWVYVEIISGRLVTQNELKALREKSADIVEIKIISEGEREEFLYTSDDISVSEVFDLFYKDTRGSAPPADLKKLFLRLIEED
jgi:exonuclease SbcD